MTRTSLIEDVDGANPPQDKGPGHLEEETCSSSHLKTNRMTFSCHTEKTSVSMVPMETFVLSMFRPNHPGTVNPGQITFLNV